MPSSPYPIPTGRREDVLTGWRCQTGWIFIAGIGSSVLVYTGIQFGVLDSFSIPLQLDNMRPHVSNLKHREQQMGEPQALKFRIMVHSDVVSGGTNNAEGQHRTQNTISGRVSGDAVLDSFSIPHSDVLPGGTNSAEGRHRKENMTSGIRAKDSNGTEYF